MDFGCRGGRFLNLVELFPQFGDLVFVLCGFFVAIATNAIDFRTELGNLGFEIGLSREFFFELLNSLFVFRPDILDFLVVERFELIEFFLGNRSLLWCGIGR